MSLGLKTGIRASRPRQMGGIGFEAEGTSRGSRGGVPPKTQVIKTFRAAVQIKKQQKIITAKIRNKEVKKPSKIRKAFITTKSRNKGKTKRKIDRQADSQGDRQADR